MPLERRAHTLRDGALGSRGPSVSPTLAACLDIRQLFSRVLRTALLFTQVTGKNLIVSRLYANGHTFGQGGSIHVDEDGTENYAAIYYANLEWQPQWLGHTHYLPGTMRDLPAHPDRPGPDLDISLAVLPKAQRLAIHDGRQCHVGTAPHRSFPGLRVTLAWKFTTVNEPHPDQTRTRI